MSAAPLRTERLPQAYAPAADALAGRVVLVLGAAGGVGSAAARAAAAAGANVVLLGRRVPALERVYDELVAAREAQHAIYPLDLQGADPGDYDALAQSIEREYGRLDGVLVASAHFAGLTPLAQTAADDWMRALHVNLAAPWLLLQACLPLLGRSADASVVFVLDDCERIGRAYWGGYGVAQHGLHALAAMLADELENSSVRVHGLLPGPLGTALRARAYFGENPASLRSPATLAPALVYLLGSDGAGARGSVLDVRGALAAEA